MHAGKVRELYAIDDDRLLMVATDQISAFDHVLAASDPRQGRDLEPAVAVVVRPAGRPGREPRVVNRGARRRARPGRDLRAAGDDPDRVRRPRLPDRLGLAGVSGDRVGLRRSHLPAGLVDGSRLPEPIFTPATKAALGEHDENVDFATVVDDGRRRRRRAICGR